MDPLEREGHLPEALRPMLAMRVAEPFDSPDHFFEASRPGIRVLAFVTAGRAALKASNLLDVTPAFREIAGNLRQAVRGDGMVLDGVITPVADDASSHLPRLMRQVYEQRPRPRPLGTPGMRQESIQAVLEVFDVLYIGYRPVLEQPLVQRKALLANAFVPNPGVRLAYSEENRGISIFEAATRLGMEGCVAKLRDSAYELGKRSPSWVKVGKPRKDGKVVIGGYTIGAERRRQPFESLLLGANDGGRLRFVGSVTGGFKEGEAAILHSLLSRTQAAHCPFVEQPETGRLLYWCEPRVVLQVAFGEVTGDRLQFPIFKMLRPDTDPLECSLEALRQA